MKKFDLIIAGAGMVGATAALALSQLNLKIALVDLHSANLEVNPGFDQRAVALSAASVKIFKSLGLWPTLEPLACPIYDIHVSDQGHFGFTRLHASEYAMDALGQVIPLDQTGPILWKIIDKNKNIQLFPSSQISGIEQDNSADDNRVVASMIAINPAAASIKNKQQKEQKLTAKLLLAADGTFSSIAKMAAINIKNKNYYQHAVIANIATEIPHNNRAFERFTQQGPLALLPLTRNRMSLVWCQTKNRMEKIMDSNDNEFIAQLQQEFGYRLGRICKVGKRFEYPLALHLADKTFGQRVLLLGNSAHTLHPIAGQGFNLGLRDIAALYDLIQQAQNAQKKGKSKDEDHDIGSNVFLQHYQQHRKTDWQQTITATDTLVGLFSNDFLPLVIARNKALCLLDKIPLAKEKLAMTAMGLSGESAKLTRGLL